MNYINRLENELAEKTTELDTLQRELNSFRAYLTTDKFATDRTIQVQDVENRLMDARNIASMAATMDANMRTFDGQIYSKQQLDRVWNKVLDDNEGGAGQEDWKGSIHVSIYRKHLAQTKAAIGFFTATEVTIVQEQGDHVLIQAAGYRAGPAS